ncbi:MAG: glycerophosphodiester phosphodiesterase [Bacilli bacterium]|nr:glycerophosphodiester phosphodiesterase [Bacilli bacterium]MDD4809418.1 glycerophosphodiester phosphodiesterase [Bacilli bacterium]
MKLISHRGNNNHHYLENTKDAIINSLSKHYIDGVEIDVRITKDSEIVVFHDSFVDLISDGMGEIKDLTLVELKKLTLGKKERIATLDEILGAIKTNKKIIIEIKEGTNKYKKLVDEVYLIIKKYPYLNIEICSFNYKLVKYFKRKYKKVRVGLIIGVRANRLRIYNHFDFNSIYKAHMSYAKRNDYLWTINDIDELENINDDVAIITDKAYLLKDYLKKDKIKNA